VVFSARVNGHAAGRAHLRHATPPLPSASLK
jgi:hypothetical protein